MTPEQEAVMKKLIHPDVLAMARRMAVKNPLRAAVNYVRRNAEGGTAIGPAEYELMKQEERKGANRAR